MKDKTYAISFAVLFLLLMISLILVIPFNSSQNLITGVAINSIDVDSWNPTHLFPAVIILAAMIFLVRSRIVTKKR